MRLLSFFKQDSLTKRLDRVKMGDEEEREKIIKEYLPFMIKTISNYTGKYIESENSEEYSVGIGAFNEAIDKYNSSRGSFISFTELVIKNRLTDYFRKMNKYKNVVPISQLNDHEKNRLERHFKIQDFTEGYCLKDEIVELEKQLKDFDITFKDLVKDAPKHIDTRMNALYIAKFITKNEEIKEILFRKKTLPNTKIMKELDVSLKVLKRSRKFIIAAVIILDSDFECIKEYISNNKGGVSNGL